MSRVIPFPHTGAEILSAYLDGELPAGERKALEAHVAICPGCRAELASLRTVIERLRRLERAAPPSVLAQQVARRVALETRQPGMVARLEAALAGLPLDSATLLNFGVVLALAAILGLFVLALESPGPPEAPAAADTADAAGAGYAVVGVVVGERTFDRDGSFWRERGAGDPVATWRAGDPAAVALLAGEPRLADLLGSADGIVLHHGDGTILLQP